MKNQKQHLIQLAFDILQPDADDLSKQIIYEDFDTRVRSYLEAPQQLDIFIPDIMNKLVPAIISDIEMEEITNKYVYSMVYTLIDVRGIQQLKHFFPNNAKTLQQTVQLLKIHQQSQNVQHQQQNDNITLNNIKFAKIDQDTSLIQQNYRVSFIILYYLSILVITPFQINDLNSTGSLSDDIVKLCLQYHNEAPKLGQMANQVLGRFLVRPDCDNRLQKVIQKGNNLIQNILTSDSKLTRQQEQQQVALWIQLLSFIVRFAKASGKFVQVLYNVELLNPLIVAPNREVRKIAAVLCSRISQSYLNNQYSWSQSLIQKTVKLQNQVNQFDQKNNELLNELQGFNVPEAFDAYVDGLLHLSEDEEGSVRIIAAQGLAGLCGKLPRLFSAEIVEALLDTCSPTGDASAWSGALVALANCALRRLLSPQNLTCLVGVIDAAISQRFLRGGAVVKDSACLAAWAVARGYHGYFIRLYNATGPSFKRWETQTIEITLLKQITQLSVALASTAVLSRDLQARRAAGAAFQEIAGRIGAPLVPSAIQVAALCDYYALGDINICYNQTAVEIATLNQLYKNQLLTYILDAQIQGNTIQERQLAAELMIKLIFLPQTNKQQDTSEESKNNETFLQIIDKNAEIETVIEGELIQRIEDSENWTQWAGTIQVLTLLVQQDGFKTIFQKYEILYKKIIEYIAAPPKPPTVDGQFQVITVLFQCYNILVQLKQLKLDVNMVVKALQQNYPQTISFRKNDLAVQNYEKLFDNSLYVTIQLLQDSNFENFEQISSDKICLASMLQTISSKRFKDNNDTFITQLYNTFKNNLTAKNTEIRLFVLRAIEQHVKDIEFKAYNKTYQNLYAIIRRAVNDYALDKHGDVGALVRHRGSIVLRTLIKHLKENADLYDQKIQDEILALHQQTIARNCCSKVETLKLLAIRSLFEDQQQGIQLVKCDVKEIMGKYLNKQQQSNVSDPESQIFNMAELTVYELKKQLQLEDLLLVNNNYDLLYDVFLNDDIYKNTCFLELLSNFSLYTEKDLKQIIKLIKMQSNDYIYEIILQQFDKITNKGRQSTVQYSCIQAIDYLINHNYEPPITTVSQLIDKIDHYISQDLIAFQVYPHAFSIFEFYAYKYDIQLCFDLLVKYLTSETIKVRDIAFSSILMLFINKKVADQKIQEISTFDFMLVKPDVLQTQILTIKDLAKKTK